MQVDRPAVLIATGAAVERWRPSTGARSALRSCWPERELLCVACREMHGHDVVVASGEVVPEAPAPGAAAPVDTLATGAGIVSGAGIGGDLFSSGGLETVGRGKRKGRRSAQGGGGGASRLGVAGSSCALPPDLPSADGRSPLERWDAGAWG